MGAAIVYRPKYAKISRFEICIDLTLNMCSIVYYGSLVWTIGYLLYWINIAGLFSTYDSLYSFMGGISLVPVDDN